MSNLEGHNLSAGCDNSYTIGCDALSRRTHYCICVNFLRAVEEYRIGESFVDCQRALRRGECEAYRLRQEEMKAGKALYYVPRKKREYKVESRPMAKKTYSTPKRTKPTRVPTPKPKSEDELIVGSNMAEVITAAAKSDKSPLSYPKPKRGESLLSFSKRFKAYNEIAKSNI